jgi:hypothetical protein
VAKGLKKAVQEYTSLQQKLTDVEGCIAEGKPSSAQYNAEFAALLTRADDEYRPHITTSHYVPLLTTLPEVFKEALSDEKNMLQDRLLAIHTPSFMSVIDAIITDIANIDEVTDSMTANFAVFILAYEGLPVLFTRKKVAKQRVIDKPTLR